MIEEKHCSFCDVFMPCVAVVNDGKIGHVCQECMNHIFKEFVEELKEV